jgi:hypothetical protein
MNMLEEEEGRSSNVSTLSTNRKRSDRELR